MLIERLSISEEYKIKDNVEIYNLLRHYYKVNQKFNYMAIEPVALNVKKLTYIVQSKGYTIPVKYQTQANIELERLLKLEIIEESRAYGLVLLSL